MSRRYRLPAFLSFALSVLLAVAAAGALFVPAVYAREAPIWAAQGMGQDWVDLVLVAPALAAAAAFVLRGSRLAVLVLGGLVAYALYSLVLYAFFLHFGPLFLVYAWALGLAFYALVALVSALAADDVRDWFGPGAPVRSAGGLSVFIGAAFYALWLAEALPALAAGRMPQSAVDAGLITNPVHVLDLGVVLPAFIAGGAALTRRRPFGYWLTPVMLAFAVAMDVALMGMSMSMRVHDSNAGGPPLGLLGVMTLSTAAVLAWLLRWVRQP
jgi:hypothetical protein